MKKKLFTFLKVYLTLFLLCGVSNAWGAESKTYSLTFSSGSLGTVDAPTQQIGDAEGKVKWNVSWTWNDSSKKYFGWDNTKGVQVGKGTSGYGGTIVTLSTTDISGTITKVTANGSVASSGSGNITVKVGDEDFTASNKTKASLTTTATGYEFTGSGSGEIKVTFTNTNTGKAMYIKSITVTYEAAAPTTAYTVTFDAGTNGTCTEASLTEASAGAGVTLPSCTANEGYVFKGWSTTENGATSDAGAAGATYNPTSNCTLYAVYEDASVITAEQSSFTATSASELGGDENITYSTAKNSGTAEPRINNSEILLYQASSGNGGSITISAVDGYKLSQVTIGSSISTSVNYKLDSNTSMSLTSTASITANGTYTISNLNNNSVTIFCMSGNSSNRLSVNYIQVKYKEEVNDGPYTITYKPNGAAENEYTQENLIKGNNITLTANTFTREGYSFAGWNTKFDGTGVSYSDGATIENISKNYTLYAQWTINSYTLTKDAVHTPNVEAGTFKLFAGDKEVTESAQVPYGMTITISDITPATGYTFDAWRYKIGNDGWVSRNKSFTMEMPAGNMEIECNFAELDEVTIKLSDMGVVSTVQQYKTYKIADVLPKPTTEYDGFTFCGWSKTATAGTANIIGNDEVATEDITLYAVYSKTVGVANTYKRVTDISELTDGITVFIANNTGKAPKNNNGTLSYISNPTESNSEITVEDAGALWTLGKTSSGYSFTNGDKMLGSTGTTNVSFTSDNSTNWEITESSKDGIFFIKHGDYYFEYNSGWTGYKITSTPSTTQRDSYVGNKLYIPASETVYSLGANMSITSAKWGTFCAPFDVTIPEGVTAYIATESNGEVVFDSDILVDGVLMAGVPVVVYSESEVNKNFVDVPEKTEATCAEGALVGVYTAKSGIPVTTKTNQNYVLQNNAQGVGFYKAVNSISLKANRCYMTLPASSDAKPYFAFDEIITGINNILNPTDKSVEGIFDLSGRKLSAPQKGINIINGVKVIVK